MKAFTVLVIIVCEAWANRILQNISWNSRITNGYDAAEGQVPYMVGLLFSNDEPGAWWCGGSIIGNTWVVTAAHCTNNSGIVNIRYGGLGRDQPQFDHTVGNADFIQNQYWPDINGNDISLIRTPHVDFNDRVNKVELPTLNNGGNNYANKWALSCGWGGYYDGSGLADQLQCVDMQIIENDECAKIFGDMAFNVLCTATPEGKSTCGGDSGGPLVENDNHRLVGVTSAVAADGCQLEYPAIFTRVTVHLQWIKDNTGIGYR